jgi:hypothetical protein
LFTRTLRSNTRSNSLIRGVQRRFESRNCGRNAKKYSI